MSRTKKAIIGVVALMLIGASAGAAYWLRRPIGPEIITEAIKSRNLEAIVSASGKVQPKRQVNISANTMGRVTRVAVEEGQRVKAGQFLLEIDPRSLEGQLQRGEASVAAAQSSLQQSRVNVDQSRTTVEQSKVALDLARQTLQRQQELWKDGLTTKEALDRAQNDLLARETEVRSREAEVRAREQDIQTREQQIKQEQASLATTRYNLNQVIISSPMDGLVTRRNIEEGETAVVGTMNNAGTVLMTIADMSVIEAEVEVDETDIPNVQLGQLAKVTIDAVPDREFKGRVTEIGNSPTQNTTTQNTGQRQATTFTVVVTIEEKVPDVRPGFTCTAEITTATRANVVSVPIQALTVREMLFDPAGKLVHEPPPPPPSRFSRQPPPRPAPAEPPPGHERKETEGVFLLQSGRAVFAPVKIGVAGEQYFEVTTGLKAGDQVITGPFASVRELADGQEVRLQANAPRPAASP
jgi:HlyD family secretion protein